MRRIHALLHRLLGKLTRAFRDKGNRSEASLSNADTTHSPRLDRRTWIMRLAAAPVLGGLLYPLTSCGRGGFHRGSESVTLQ